MSSLLCQFFYWSLFFVSYTLYTHKNKKIKDSYSYVYDSIHSKDSSEHDTPYTSSLPTEGDPTLSVHLNPFYMIIPTFNAFNTPLRIITIGENGMMFGKISRVQSTHRSSLS